MDTTKLIGNIVMPSYIEDEIIPIISKFYRHNENYYHTLNHIKTCYMYLFKHIHEFNKEFNHEIHIKELLAAIAFHDSYYIPGETFNEEISANIFESYYKNITSKCIFSFLNVKLIILIIKSTHYNFLLNYSEASYPEIQIMHDLDYASMSNNKLLQESNKTIYNEYIDIVKNGEDTLENKYIYLKNRIAFLKGLINNPKDIFMTDTMNSQYEYITRDNINDSILFLEKELNYIYKKN